MLRLWRSSFVSHRRSALVAPEPVVLALEVTVDVAALAQFDRAVDEEERQPLGATLRSL